MGSVEERLRGRIDAQAVGAEPEKLLNVCAAEGLSLLEPRAEDRWTLRFSVFERDWPRLEALCARSGCELRAISQRGGSRYRRLLRRRAGLLLTLAELLGLLLASSIFVWEIRFVGAEGLSRGELLRVLADCGLESGSYWPALDFDALRDKVLLREPALHWLTVNISGSVAEVRLLPRTEKPEILREGDAAELCAAKTGIVRRVSALRGEALVQPGQAVTEGEVLVAGRVESLTDEPRLLRAEGEVWADTWYELTALCPAARGKEAADSRLRGRLALKIGQKRINFYQNAGKTIDGCDKIVHEYNLGVEGLFRLPLSLVWEELKPYRTAEPTPVEAEEAAQRLIASLAERVEGEIVSCAWTLTEHEGLSVVTLRAQCFENIAKSVDITT